MRVLDLVVEPGAAAGDFTLDARGRRRRAAPAPLQPGLAPADDISMVLHTSGTTSRPKIVPLSQRNLVRLGAAHPRHAAVHAQPTAA